MSEVSKQTRAVFHPMTDGIPADMADGLARFKQAAEAITINFLGELETEPAPLALYHYTDH